jgi:hypothetical protein
MATRVNLCPNPALQVNATGWFGPTGSVRVSNLTGFGRTTGFTMGGGPGDGIGPQADVVAGTTYTFSLYARPSFTGTVDTGIDWYDDGGYLASSPGASTINVTNGVITRLAVTAVAPAGATAGLQTTSYSGASIVTTMHLVEAATSAGEYFDGATLGAVWDNPATPGNSTSTLISTANSSTGRVTLTGSVVGSKRVSHAGTGTVAFAGASTGGKRIAASSTGRITVAGSTVAEPVVPQKLGYRPFWLGPLATLRELPPPHYGTEVGQDYVETAAIHESLTGSATKDVLGYHREWSWSWRYLLDEEALPLLALRTSPPLAPLRLIDSYSGGNLLSADAGAAGSVSRSTTRFTVTAGSLAHIVMPSLPDELIWYLDGGLTWQLPAGTAGQLMVEDTINRRVPVVPGINAVARMWVAASDAVTVQPLWRPYTAAGTAQADVLGAPVTVPGGSVDELTWRSVRVGWTPPPGVVAAAAGLRMTAAAGARTVYVTGISAVHAEIGRRWSPGGGAPEVIVTDLKHSLPSPTEHHMSLTLREV